MKPVCITGMHRSGTSLVAGLLQRHGLWLGDDRDLMPADPHNPAGYFEHVRAVRVNDEILEFFGGDWSTPPILPADWIGDPGLEPQRQAARQLKERVGERPWGFKDPRASLTLPFWRAELGDLLVVICLRNPLEVARSLQHRDGIAQDRAFDLWRTYYEALLGTTNEAERLVIEYESLCADPVAGTAQLVEWLPGLGPLSQQAALALARPTLRHHRADDAELAAQGAPVSVIELYSELRAELLQPAPVAPETALEATLAAWDLSLRDLHMDVIRLQAAVARLEAELHFARADDLAGIAASVADQRRQISALEVSVAASANGAH